MTEATTHVIRAIVYADRVGDRPPMIDSMFTAARVLLARGDGEALATLMGGIQEGWFAPMAKIVRPEHDIDSAVLGAIRSDLGNEAYARARARGAAMSYDEIIAFTLQELRSLPS